LKSIDLYGVIIPQDTILHKHSCENLELANKMKCEVRHNICKISAIKRNQWCNNYCLQSSASPTPPPPILLSHLHLFCLQRITYKYRPDESHVWSEITHLAPSPAFCIFNKGNCGCLAWRSCLSV
jgi:hypothetical protein